MSKSVDLILSAVKSAGEAALRLHEESESLRSRLADYELLKRAVNETGDCLPDCDSYAHNEQCPNVNNHVVLQDKQREIESLRSRLAEDEKLYDELNNDYVLVRNNRDEIARELGETNEALAACQSQGAGLQARLAELREAARKVTCRTCSGNGHTFIGIDPCPDCGDLRRLLGEKP